MIQLDGKNGRIQNKGSESSKIRIHPNNRAVKTRKIKRVGPDKAREAQRSSLPLLSCALVPYTGL